MAEVALNVALMLIEIGDNSISGLSLSINHSVVLHRHGGRLVVKICIMYILAHHTSNEVPYKYNDYGGIFSKLALPVHLCPLFQHRRPPHVNPI